MTSPPHPDVPERSPAPEARKRPSRYVRFVLLRGMIGWGLPMALLWALATTFWKLGFSWQNLQSEDFRSKLGIAVIVFPIAGFFWAHQTWKRKKR